MSYKKIFAPITTTNKSLKPKVDYLNHQKIPFHLLYDKFLHLTLPGRYLLDITHYSVEELNKLIIKEAKNT